MLREEWRDIITRVASLSTRRVSRPGRAGVLGNRGARVFLEVALNGSRTRAEHPAVPLTSIQQAREASAALAAGAEAGHVHVRGADGRESLAPEDVAATLLALRAAC